MKLYLIILIFLLASCKKDKVQYNIPCISPTNNIKISENLILGKWIWVSEYYVQPFTGNIFLKTPQSEGYTRQLNVYSDMLEFFKNNSFEQRYRYEFVIENSITNYPDDTTNVLVFKDYSTGQRSNYVHYKICNDTLTLNFQIRSDAVGQVKWAKIK
ncbi:MAG: hypothetical protein ACOYVG_15610 [Bacteroidota bacterium]